MTAIAHHPHRVSSAVADVRAALSRVADASLWSMDAAETDASLAGVLAAEAQLAELKARLLSRAHDADLAGQAGATSTANWLAVRSRTTRATAHRAMRLAGFLDTHEVTRSALAGGDVHVEQAEAVARALAELPDDLDPDLAEEAERHLLAEADRFDATALRHLGRHLLEVVDPEAADAHHARLLEAEEREASAAQRLTMWEDSHGKVHGRFTLDALTGAMLKKALLGFAAPKHRAATTGALGERRPTPVRLGQAFAELVQRYPTDRLPDAGGVNATVVVTMTLDSLLGGLKAAHLDTGHPISAALARRLACDAGLVPAVLGTDGSVLDLGRRTRLFTAKQRIALGLEQRGCAAEGCDHPPGLCHAHHAVPWSLGGRTDLANGLLLCPKHHRIAHDAAYTQAKRPGGKVAFTRRT